jgi:outer membrane receptor protein involved in Fe transport
LVPEAAQHFILGLDRSLNETWDLRLEGYYKKLWDLTVEDTFQFYTNNGSGRNYGLEILLEKKPTNRSRFSGWLSYAASKARRRDRAGFPEYDYLYDQPHVLTAIANYKFSGRTQLGLKWKLTSGQPYTPIVGRIFTPYAPGDTAGYWEGIPGGKNSERLPWYHRLDVRIDRKFHLKGLSMAGYLEIFNLYAHKNVGGYQWSRDYSKKEPYYQLPFLPTAGLSWEF